VGDEKILGGYESSGSHGIHQRPFQTNPKQRGVFNFHEWITKIKRIKKAFPMERLFL
jgi:hypothetical protein